MSILVDIARDLGTAIGTFRKSQAQVLNVRAGERKLLGNTRRPEFLADTARSSRWSPGEVVPNEEWAQRRAVRNSWFWSGLNLKAGTISSSELQILSAPGGADSDEAVVLPAHPFMKLLQRPNPLMGRGYLWQYSSWWFDLSGNFYWFMNPGDGDQPNEIWPLPSNKVNPVPSMESPGIEYYEYVSGGKLYQINPYYVCHVKTPNPFDIYRGLPSLIAGMLSIDGDTAMAMWNAGFYSSDNVMPSAIINLGSGDPETPIDPDDLKAVKRQLQEDYGAIKRKTAITNAERMDVQLLGWTAKDMDFLLGREFSKDEILSILGIPPGYRDKNSTEANAKVGEAAYAEFMWGVLGLISEELTAQVLQRFYSDKIEAQFKDIRPKDRELELKEDRQADGVLTINERRRRFWDADPVEGGDEESLFPKQPAAGDVPLGEPGQSGGGGPLDGTTTVTVLGNQFGQSAPEPNQEDGEEGSKSIYVFAKDHSHYLKRYNPNQPRDPKGKDTGGRWTSQGGSPSPDSEDKKDKPMGDRYKTPQQDRADRPEERQDLTPEELTAELQSEWSKVTDDGSDRRFQGEWALKQHLSKQAGSQTLIARDQDGNLVGALGGVASEWNSDYFVYNMATAQDGHGRDLMVAASEQALAHMEEVGKPGSLYIEATTESYEFFENLGMNLDEDEDAAYLFYWSKPELETFVANGGTLYKAMDMEPDAGVFTSTGDGEVPAWADKDQHKRSGEPATVDDEEEVPAPEDGEPVAPVDTPEDENPDGDPAQPDEEDLEEEPPVDDDDEDELAVKALVEMAKHDWALLRVKAKKALAKGDIKNLTFDSDFIHPEVLEQTLEVLRGLKGPGALDGLGAVIGGSK